MHLGKNQKAKRGNKKEKTLRKDKSDTVLLLNSIAAYVYR
jgi:hypothetical protein